MELTSVKEARRTKRRGRIRSRITGTAARPRLSVFKSLNHIYVQVIDDENGRTVAHASSRDKECLEKVKTGGNVVAAKLVGTLIATRLKEKGLQEVVFDRGGYPYHGRVKAVAEAARETGLKF